MPPGNFLAYTSGINPKGSEPKLTIEQIWSCLQLKIKAGEKFVGGAILSTEVISTSFTKETNLPVIVREVIFKEGNRKVREECISFEPMKVEFHQPDGSKVQNIISEDSDGELFMTYTFEWLHQELKGNQEQLKEKLKGEKALAKKAVESTIDVMRELVRKGEVK